LILAIGTDIVDVRRIAEAMQRFPRFAERILNPLEMASLVAAAPTHQRALEFLSGRWAGKEAIKKCLPHITSWHQIQILPQPDGKPFVSVEGLPLGQRIHVSISHERTHAVAFAVLESTL